MWRLKLFIVGWQQQSKIKLFEAGCPMWLIEWRCPPPVWPQWLGEFIKLLPREDGDSEGIEKEPK